jgi:hypothetical protein
VPLWALIAIVGGLGYAVYRKTDQEHADESRALEADLAELPEPMRTQTRQALFLAQPADLPQLAVLAQTMRASGWNRAAARVEQKIGQLQAAQKAAAQKGYGPQT